MPRFLSGIYILRILAICVIFTVLSVGLLPVFAVRARDYRNNLLFCRWLMFILRPVLGIRFDIDRSAAVYDDEPVVLVVNHQGALDLISCAIILPKRAATLAKRSLGIIPVWGQMLWLGGSSLVDRSKPAGRKKAMSDLNRMIGTDGVALIIFPEGTRNRSNNLGKFHHGAFRCALQNRVRIQPIVFSTYTGKVSLRRWQAGTVAIKVLPPLDVPPVDASELAPFVESVRQQMQTEIRALDQTIDASAALDLAQDRG